MKNFFLNKNICLVFTFFLILSKTSLSQDLDVVITVTHYGGSSTMTCHGAHDGAMEAVIVGGTAPYSYQWNNGSYTAFTKSISGLGPGDYVFTVIDGNNDTISKNAKIYEVDALVTNAELSHFEGGYNISTQGGNDGFFIANVEGGTAPYSYMWNTGSENNKVMEVVAGTYSVTITDANGCTTSLSETLTEPTPLHIVSLTSPLHHGYNISCNGGSDGAINLSVAGGVPPYVYSWNSGDTTSNLDSLKGGTWTVTITDLNNAHLTRSIYLSQPKIITADLSPTVYSNGSNVTCFNCADGYISSNVIDGVSPYTYLWNTGQTTSNLTGVVARNYILQVTDVNGCSISKEISLVKPDRDDWTMLGNSGTNPAIQYIGTSDNKDFSFKTNNLERMRIDSIGNIRISKGLTVDSLNITSRLMIGGRHAIHYQNANGNYPEIFSFGGIPFYSPYGISSCISPALNTVPNYQFHGTIQLYGNSASGGNLDVMELGFDGMNSIIDATGTSSDPNGNRLLINYYCGKDVFICGNGGRIKLGGPNTIVGVGVDPTTVNQNGDYKLFVADGIRTEKVKVDLRSNWPDFVFDGTYKLMSIKDLSGFIDKYGHLPGITTETEVKEFGLDLGANQVALLQKIEELSLYIIELNNKYEHLKSELININNK